jgi:hypothetical protein
MATPASPLFETTDEPGRYWAEPALGVFIILDMEKRVVRTLLATEFVSEEDGQQAALRALRSIGIIRLDRCVGKEPIPGGLLVEFQTDF